MQICICGWYYWQKFMHLLDGIHEKYPVFVVAHRYDPVLVGRKYDHYIRENVGVEYGAYDWFVKNQWDKKSKVLFMHDDVEILPIIKDYEIMPPIAFFDSIAGKDVDIGYIFNSRMDERVNYGVHGRGIIMSARFIDYLLKNHDGIWWDAGNDGHINGPTPEHCLHFNEADYRLRGIWRDLQEEGSNMKLGVPIYSAAFSAAYRGGATEGYLKAKGDA